MRVIGGLGIVFGAILLIKAITTLAGDTAWEQGMSASRDGDPFGYWSSVVSYLVLGGGVLWIGVGIWRER